MILQVYRIAKPYIQTAVFTVKVQAFHQEITYLKWQFLKWKCSEYPKNRLCLIYVIFKTFLYEVNKIHLTPILYIMWNSIKIKCYLFRSSWGQRSADLIVENVLRIINRKNN